VEVAVIAALVSASLTVCRRTAGRMEPPVIAKRSNSTTADMPPAVLVATEVIEGCRMHAAALSGRPVSDANSQGLASKSFD
jgi:hypothetical protein